MDLNVLLIMCKYDKMKKLLSPSFHLHFGAVGWSNYGDGRAG